MITTIRRNSRQIPELKEQLTECKVYRLENYFAGEACNPSYAWEKLQSRLRARLTENGNGTFTVHVHDNLWYELRAGTP